MDLQQRWVGLWERIGAFGDPLPVFAGLAARYSEPHRFFHDFAHIQFCLSVFDQVKHLAEFPDFTEVGLWFHDAVYDPKAQDNEEKSAKLFREIAHRNSFPLGIDSRIAYLILATKHGQNQNLFGDERLIADIDLSTLAVPWEVFLSNYRDVRREYSWLSDLSDHEFDAGRAEFFKVLLARDDIYHTEHFQKRCEAAARKNIKDWLSTIES